METKRGSTGLFFTLIACALLLFVFDRSGIVSSLRGLLENALGFVVKPGQAVKAVSFANDKISRLEEERNGLAEKVALLEKVKSENEALRSQLGSIQTTSRQNLLMASVLATGQFFIVDKGQDDGVEVGDVVVFKNILVGKIVSVSKKVSRIALPIEKESIVVVATRERGAKGLIKGEGERATFSEVFLSENLTDDDTLVTIGDVDEKGLGIPPGLLVGTIEQIRKSDDELFYEAKLVPLLDYTRLTHVFIVM